MKLILFDTCGTEASLALADTERDDPIVASSSMPGRTASENLIAELRKTIVGTGWGLSAIEAIVVVTGPGSFTGVRVGLSAAKGLGEAIDRPLVAVSRLAMLAAAARQEYEQVCALLDAGRGEFYCGQFTDGVEPRETLMSREEAEKAALLAQAVVVCEPLVLEALSGSLTIRLVSEPGAADAFPLALRKIQAGLFDDALTLDASYLRRTDAEIFASRQTERRG